MTKRTHLPLVSAVLLFAGCAGGAGPTEGAYLAGPAVAVNDCYYATTPAKKLFGRIQFRE